MTTRQSKKKQPRLDRMQLSRLKVKDLQRLLPGGMLDTGDHILNEDSVPDAVCLMEAVAWVSGEEHSDHPKCACPVLTDIGIEINDSMDDSDRQALIPAIAGLVGSRTSSKRTYFRRVKYATEMVVDEALVALDFSSLRKGHDNAIWHVILSWLEDAKGRPLTKSLLKRLSDGLDYLSNETGDIIINEIREVMSLLRDLHYHWTPSQGISFDEYRQMLSNFPFYNTISHKRLPEFFVGLSTIHA